MADVNVNVLLYVCISSNLPLILMAQMFETTKLVTFKRLLQGPVVFIPFNIMKKIKDFFMKTKMWYIV